MPVPTTDDKKKDQLTNPLRVRDDQVQLRVQRIGNGYIVKAGGENHTFFREIEDAAEAIREAIEQAFGPEW